MSLLLFPSLLPITACMSSTMLIYSARQTPLLPFHVLLQITACMIGTTIALRYAADRPQFGDKLIGDYLTHQRRLLPGLATTYALQLGMKQLKVCIVIYFMVEHRVERTTASCSCSWG
jgi:hypothetical protein